MKKLSTYVRLAVVLITAALLYLTNGIGESTYNALLIQLPMLIFILGVNLVIFADRIIDAVTMRIRLKITLLKTIFFAADILLLIMYFAPTNIYLFQTIFSILSANLYINIFYFIISSYIIFDFFVPQKIA